MGCVPSKVEDEEAVRRCKERKKLIKQLLACRTNLANTHFSYLKSLRDTGSALRQFAEVESSPEEPTKPAALPSSLTVPPPSPPPLPNLPPSPPPLPQFSPIVHKYDRQQQQPESYTRDNYYSEIDSETESCVTPRPPPPPGVDWKWDPLGSPVLLNSSSFLFQRSNMINGSEKDFDDEYWEETNTDVKEEELDKELDKEIEKGNDLGEDLREEDDVSQASWHTKESDVMPAVLWRDQKSLIEIVKEIDEHFLKAAAGGQDVVLFLEMDSGQLQPQENDGKNGKKLKSAKVFSTLSFNRSFRSTSANGRTKSFRNSSSDSYCHGNTLHKILEEEQRLCKLVMDDEQTKFLYQKMLSELQKLEVGNHDLIQANKMREKIDELEIRKISLQEAVKSTSMSIAVLRDEELFPQLIELSAGLAHMWREMHECHQFQTQVAEKARLLENRPGTEPTTEPHREAARQLEMEVANWHSAFSSLVSSQRTYVQTLCKWVQLTDALPDPGGFVGIRTLCEDLNRAYDKLPEKAAADAIKNFLSVIHSIVLQQAEERRLKKRSDVYEAKLTKKLMSFNNTDKEGSSGTTTTTIKDPSINEAKLESLKKKVGEERVKYLNSIQVSRAMSVNNLQTGLPNVFRGLTGFAGVCVQAFEGINGSGGAVVATPS